MSHKSHGKTISLHIGRRLVNEYMHQAKKVPTLPLARTCRIPELVAARKLAAQSPSWMAIFLKAFGLVSQRVAELRQAWIPFPYTRLYEHPNSEAAVLVEREVDGGQVVLGAKIRCPEETPLLQIDGHLKRYRDTPVEEITAFRQLIRLGKLPGFLRRFFLWRILWVNGERRANRIGTFVISSLGNYGVEQMHPLTALTTYFTFGPISASGEVTLKIVYDHRVMDGRTVAKALVLLDEVLNQDILKEVRGLARQAA